MPRTGPPCPPDKPEIRFFHPHAERQTYAIEVITPLFGGGVEPGVNDPVTLIRPSAIRGHLRFWWRATRGARLETVEALRQREGEIWGTTKNPSPVSVNVEIAQRSGERRPGNFGFDAYGRPEAYVLFAAKQRRNVLCHEGLQFSLTLQWTKHDRLQALRRKENEQLRKMKKQDLPDINDIRPDIEAAVWAWVNFGGVGARTRRGCGALYCSQADPQIPDLHPQHVDDFAAWLEIKANEYDFPWLDRRSPRPWPTLSMTI